MFYVLNLSFVRFFKNILQRRRDLFGICGPFFFVSVRWPTCTELKPDATALFSRRDATGHLKPVKNRTPAESTEPRTSTWNIARTHDVGLVQKADAGRVPRQPLRT